MNLILGAEISRTYRLTFWQFLVNPIASFLGRFISGLLAVVTFYALIQQLNVISVSLFIAFLIGGFVIFWLPLFYGFGKISFDEISIEVYKSFLISNFGSFDSAQTKFEYPLSTLKVERGFLSCSVLRNSSGHYIIIPNQILSNTEILMLK